MDQTLQGRIDEALDEAIFANLFNDLMERSPQEVAEDLLRFNVEFKDETVERLVPCVKDYMAWYATEKAKGVIKT